MPIDPVQKKALSVDVRSPEVRPSASVSRRSSLPPPHTEKVRFSPQGDLLNKLTNLQHQDPVKFLKMAEDMAAELRGAALSSGEGSSGPLIRLAERVTAMAHSTATKPQGPHEAGSADGSKAGSSTARSHQLYRDHPESRDVRNAAGKDPVVEALHKVNEALAQTPEQLAAKSR